MPCCLSRSLPSASRRRFNPRLPPTSPRRNQRRQPLFLARPSRPHPSRPHPSRRLPSQGRARRREAPRAFLRFRNLKSGGTVPEPAHPHVLTSEASWLGSASALRVDSKQIAPLCPTLQRRA